MRLTSEVVAPNIINESANGVATVQNTARFRTSGHQRKYSMMPRRLYVQQTNQGRHERSKLDISGRPFFVGFCQKKEETTC